MPAAYKCPSGFQGHLLNFKVTEKNPADFDPNWAFPDCNSFEFTNGFEMIEA